MPRLENGPLYLDSAATTPVDPRVKEVMLPYFDEIFGNPSSSHIYGKQAKRAIEIARGHIANLINAIPNEVYFTSGATESINWAIKGYLEANSNKGNHIITVKTEHKAVLNTCSYLESKGFEVTYLDVDSNGLISIENLRSVIKDSTVLISVMYVNNEIGVIQDIAEIGKMAREKEICFFCDATQAVGKVHVDVYKDNIDMLCLSGHKLNGPKGIGALFIRKELKVGPLIHGGGQEKGLRGGTYNTPLIVGLGEACRIAKEEFVERIKRILETREYWENKFEATGTGVINFKNVKHAPHILSITLVDMEAEEFLITRSKEIAASTGSACNSNTIQLSHVLESLNVKNIESILRISIH